MKKIKKKQCKTSDCRKYRVEGEEYCRACLDQMTKAVDIVVDEDDNNEPLMQVMTLTEIERYQIMALEAQISEKLVESNSLDFEQKVDDHETAHRKHQRSQRKMMLLGEHKKLQGEYNRLFDDITGRFGLDKKKMAFDIDTGIIRDLRGDTT
jgi:hypothetical protein